MSEIMLDNKVFITSKTDLKGNILYCNRTFLQYAGYSESEVLFKSHNIVRHEDMPKSVFKILWSHLKMGKEVFAFVKNKSKNGDYYWVFANFTPNYDENGVIIGYYSVRRMANPKAVEKMDSFYREVNLAEKNGGVKLGEEMLYKAATDLGITYNHFVMNLQNNIV